jgi:hypothetical protein
MRRGTLLVAAVALTGCGSQRPTVADCLNAQGFLVREHGNVVRGSSPRGVNFTLTVYPRAAAARQAYAHASPGTSVLVGDAVVDFAGNPAASPGGVPGRLSKGALARIRRCLARP